MITESRTGATSPAMYAIEQSIGRVLSSGRVDAVFGEPIERGNVTVIPCAEVMVGLGMGSGVNPRSERTISGAGEGAGGGGGAKGRPVAVIVMSPNEVKVKPIVNVTSVVGTIFSTLGSALLLFRAVARQRRAGISRRGGALPFRARRMRLRRRRQWWRW
jgi:uncharacterized spore protein YtfJ